MKTVPALTFDDEPPDSIWHGFPPVVVDGEFVAMANRVAAVMHFSEGMREYQKTGDVSAIVTAIHAIQEMVLEGRRIG